jgi:hypothetical protein
LAHCKESESICAGFVNQEEKSWKPNAYHYAKRENKLPYFYEDIQNNNN